MRNTITQSNNNVINNSVVEHKPYTFYKKYLWKNIAADHEASGRILRTISALPIVSANFFCFSNTFFCCLLQFAKSSIIIIYVGISLSMFSSILKNYFNHTHHHHSYLDTRCCFSYHILHNIFLLPLLDFLF